MTDVSQYQMLDEISHVLVRPSMYIGSITNTRVSSFIPKQNRMEEESITYNPALLKMVDEILCNSVDEHKRTGSVTEIDFSYSTLSGEISISDNGGIPVKKHSDYDMYIPTMIFGELRTGSNFSDESRIGAGMNGLGAKLTSIFSTSFRIETSDGKKKFIQEFKDNLSEKLEPSIHTSNIKGTTITFIPDYKRLKCDLDEDNIKRIEKRVHDIAGCNPKIKVSLNGQAIKINKFKDYIGMFVDEAIEDSNENWHVAVAASDDDTFRHTTFVNGVDTFNGGSHIDYIVNQLTTKLREYIKRKHKIDVKPNNIKQQMFIFINCTINAPLFTSQTKEYMSSDIKDFGTEFEVTDKFINKIIKSDVVQRVLDWAEAQQRQKELAELRKLNKQTQNNSSLKKIVKFDDATSKKRSECSCILTEGDSASKAILSARDPKSIGVFPLRGKAINVRDIKVSKLTSNAEFANIMSIMGLKLGETQSIDDLRFGKLILATDQDPDGHHIAGLVINIFQQLWPNLLKEGLLYRLNTPLLVAKYKGKDYEFMTMQSYDDWKEKNPNHSVKYHKGLGGWSSKDFKRFLSEDSYLEPLLCETDEDMYSVDLAFDKKKADERKKWLEEV